MIVIDEQLLGRGVEHQISNWYRGSVRFILDLRPNTIIKDDAVPPLLCRARQPCFVTINVRHFWRRDLVDPRFSVVCFPIQDSEVPSISPLLQRLFRHSDFRSKSLRAGHIFRINLEGRTQFYRHGDLQRSEFLL